MSKHTEGPWRQNGHQIEGPRMGLVVATCTSPRIGWAPKTHEEAMANARLIAAAPELLAALRLVELRLNQVQPGHGTRANDLRDYLFAPVRAAIARAEGGAK